MLKNVSARRWLIMTVLFVCITYGWIVIGDAWINPTLSFAGAIVLASGTVLSFSLALARAVRLKGIGLTVMLVSLVTTLMVSASVLYGVYQIVA
ncbi:hypothetical protein [Exiguobacterium sp. s161]|uniref:hypothetical protein n=1 Tax=Exiguobacterium sp. s161 TaxID=2751191 RepID=UPI001BE814C8|nr:hypothetical protein [Exiguobacterium sp. s161]